MQKAIIILFFSLLYITASAQLNEKAINVSIKQFLNYVESFENETVLDVRPAEDFGKNGLLTAISLPSKEALFNFISSADSLSPVLVYCTEGERSVTVSNILIEKGFEFVINLESGIGKHIEEIHNFNQQFVKD